MTTDRYTITTKACALIDKLLGLGKKEDEIILTVQSDLGIGELFVKRRLARLEKLEFKGPKWAVDMEETEDDAQLQTVVENISLPKESDFPDSLQPERPL